MKNMEDSSGQTATSTLTTRLRLDIVRGRLAPGTRLQVRELCAHYAAGAIPMREALSRLTGTGFVVAEDHRGFRVSTVSAAELRDITATRVFVECEALRRAIVSGSIEWEERIAGAWHRMNRLPMTDAEEPGFSTEWERAHAGFHKALIATCPSNWLRSLSELLRDQTTRYRNLSISRSSAFGGRECSRETGNEGPLTSRDVTKEHSRILEASLRRDCTLATKLLARHLWTTTELVLANGWTTPDESVNSSSDTEWRSEVDPIVWTASTER